MIGLGPIKSGLAIVVAGASFVPMSLMSIDVFHGFIIPLNMLIPWNHLMNKGQSSLKDILVIFLFRESTEL